MIINAHCHRNLLDESCIQVAVYDERLEVTSPGGLYNGLTYEEVMNGHSKIRNKGIANIFSQMGLVEAWGSGIKRILNAAEEYGLPKPRFQEFDNMFRVELFRVNPITDQANQATNQANQATNQANQDLERLDQVEDENVLSEKEITGVKSDGSYSVSIEKTDKNYTVYLKITDYSGNTSYISTNGAVTDTQMPKISVKIPDSDTGIYTSDVPVNISVSDDVQGGVSSGIKSVTYRVADLGETTQEGSLYEYTGTAKSISGLKKELSTGIVVNTAFNNSNDVQIQVTATDNAGNVYRTTNTLKIDITAPQIEVSYDNNDGDTSFGDGAYFKEARTATLKVTERNFDETKIIPAVTSSEGYAPSLSGWSVSYGTGNGDDIVHYATIYYGSDADYTFDVSMTDAAGNRNEGVNYGNSTAPDKFTIDKTIPVIAVTYDNNNAQNENYFKETRTATVTITEHNFESSRMQLTMSAADNGNAVETASISGWSDSGDTHTATITFAKDAVYTWAMSYTDKAGNKAEDLSNQNFCIDLTKPSVSISGKIGRAHV